MKIQELGQYYQDQLATIKTLADGRTLWSAEAADLTARAQADIPDTDSLLQIMHEMQRLNRVAVMGLANDAAFKAEVTKAALPTWSDFGEPPVDRDLQINLAEKLYNAKPGDTAVIVLGDQARQIGPWLVEKCRADGVPFLVQFEDPVFTPQTFNFATDEGVKAMAAHFLDMTAAVNKRILAISGLAEKEVTPDINKFNLYKKGIKPFSDRGSSGDIFYTLTVIPTRRDAQIDGIAYDDYIKLFFEMCDQPWQHIDKAQRELIKEFNAASTVRITNSDGTDVTMDIAGFTFCNSLIAKNVPGSEIFSAPRIDSLNGTVVAKGKFERNNKVVENLTLNFKDGRLVSYSAEKGQADFEREIGIDDGAKRVGELGIGTNPHLKKHVANTLLVEKIGGSFHLALGAAYTFNSYAGEPVNVDNGNRSSLHWDITTMLYGKEGRMYLDGRLIMDHGKFLDPKYDVLNRGWQAVPKDERPDYWKNYYDAPKP